MAFDLVRFAPGNINAATIGFPARDARGVMLVGIGDALVILFAKLVLISVRIGIAAAPEFFNEAFALIVGFEFPERFSLFVGNDVGDVFIQPVLVSPFEFRLYIARLFRRILALIPTLLLRQT